MASPPAAASTPTAESPKPPSPSTSIPMPISTPPPLHLHSHADPLRLTLLPNEVILTIGDAIANLRIADIVATASTCKKLHSLLIGHAYSAALQADRRQVMQQRLPPSLSSTSVVPCLPAVLWAAERNRVDTLARLWDANCQARARQPSFPNLLTSAFWCAPPHQCQRDAAHMRWRPREYNHLRDDVPLRSGWCTALHLAARAGSLDAIRALVGYGAYVDATARHVCMCGSRHMQLLYHSEGISHADDEPVSTPLHVALANQQDDAARFLVEMGANWAGKVKYHSRSILGARPSLFWDDPNSHRQHPKPAAPSRAPVTDDGQGPSTASSSTHTPAPLGSNLGLSHGSTGLRIAAANAMLPFLAWLVDGGHVLPEEEGSSIEHFDADEPAFGALHYAAHADVLEHDGGYSDDLDDRPRWQGARWGSDSGVREGVFNDGGVQHGNATSSSAMAARHQRIWEQEWGRRFARTRALVASLLALGVHWRDLTGDSRDDVMAYAAEWDNAVLAEVLEDELEPL